MSILRAFLVEVGSETGRLCFVDSGRVWECGEMVYLEKVQRPTEFSSIGLARNVYAIFFLA